jgi:hypothetical protein
VELGRLRTFAARTSGTSIDDVRARKTMNCATMLEHRSGDPT